MEQSRHSADSSGGDSSGDEDEHNKDEKHDEVSIFLNNLECLHNDLN